MGSVSVIVTAQNNEGVIRRTLGSVEDALAYFRRAPGCAAVGCEVIVVDDASTDGTPRIAAEFYAGKGHGRIIARDRPSSAGGARNLGVARSRGEYLFFLDG